MTGDSTPNKKRSPNARFTARLLMRLVNGILFGFMAYGF